MQRELASGPPVTLHSAYYANQILNTEAHVCDTRSMFRPALAVIGQRLDDPAVAHPSVAAFLDHAR